VMNPDCRECLRSGGAHWPGCANGEPAENTDEDCFVGELYSGNVVVRRTLLPMWSPAPRIIEWMGRLFQYRGGREWVETPVYKLEDRPPHATPDRHTCPDYGRFPCTTCGVKTEAERIEQRKAKT
jgi:hypothetical protein